MRTAAFRATVGGFFIACSAGLGMVATRLAGGWPATSPLLLFVGAIWVALFLATAATVWPAGMRHPGRTVMSLLLVLLVVEGGLRLTDLVRLPGSVSYFVWRPNTQVLLHPAPDVLPGITYQVSRFTTGPDGMRARAREGTDRLRILAVGGSTTEELYIDDPDTWPAIIERRLSGAATGRVWVGNTGKSGLDASDNIVLMKTLGREVRPEITVVLVGWNDMAHSLLGVLDGVDWDKGMHQFDSARSWPIVDGGWPGIAGLRTYWSALGILRLVRQWLPGFQAEFVNVNDARSYFTPRAQRERAPKTDVLPTRLQGDIARYELRLHQLALATREAGSRLVLLTQPSVYRDGAPSGDTLAFTGGGGWIPGSAAFYSAGAIAKMIAAYNEATLRVCLDEQLACLDLAAKIAPDLQHFFDDVHLNTQGSREVGAIVADFLATTLPSAR